jgi:hypothetical protein
MKEREAQNSNLPWRTCLRLSGDATSHGQTNQQEAYKFLALFTSSGETINLVENLVVNSLLFHI